MFSSIKMEKHVESELSGIFGVKLVAKNILLRSPGIHFMHIRLRHSVCSLTKIQYLQIEPSEKGTYTSESMMLKMFYLNRFVR